MPEAHELYAYAYALPVVAGAACRLRSCHTLRGKMSTQSDKVAKPANFTTKPGDNNRKKGVGALLRTSLWLFTPSSHPCSTVRLPEAHGESWAKGSGFSTRVKHQRFAEALIDLNAVRVSEIYFFVSPTIRAFF